MNLTWKSIAKVGSKIFDLSDVDTYNADKAGATAQIKADGSGVEWNTGSTTDVSVSGGVLSFVKGLLTGFESSSAGSSDAGLIGFFPGMASAPTGWLKANGAAVLIADYSTLATAIYVGNTLNPTALSGYKCTNPANPTGTRSTSGTYIVLPDLRDMVLKGVNDTGRVINSFENHQLQDHTHNLNPTIHSPGTGSTRHCVTPQASTSVSYTTTGVPATGNHGTETLVKNIALLACIKY